MSWSINGQESERVILPAGNKLTIVLPAGTSGVARCGSNYNVLSAGTITYGTYPYETEWHIDCKSGTITYSIVSLTNDEIVLNGSIGQQITSTVAVGSAVALTTATPASITNVTLTPGTWQIKSVFDVNLTGATTTVFQAGISAVNATFGAQDTFVKSPVILTTDTNTYNFVCPIVEVTVAANTIYYLVGEATFSAGTVGGYGSIVATRITKI